MLRTANCFAVGYHYDTATNTGQTLIDRWDGTSWSITPARTRLLPRTTL